MEERVKVLTKKPDVRKSNSIINNQKTGFSQPNNSPVEQILHLQRSIGNHAVQRLLKSSAIQAKLSIGKPGDIYEKEADRISEQVMRMPEPRVQRQVEEEEKKKEEEFIQTKPIDAHITPLVQRKNEGGDETGKCIDDVTKCVIKCPDKGAVKKAIGNARNMLSETYRRMKDSPPSIPEDPRDYTPMHYAYIYFFKVEKGIRSFRQIHEIKVNFKNLMEAAKSVKPKCASGDCCNCKSGEMLHDAFAVNSDIYLCPSFFTKKDPNEQARAIIHELAHARLGVGHKGARFLLWGCYSTPLKTFDESIDNAYVYDLCAFCVSHLPEK